MRADTLLKILCMDGEYSIEFVDEIGDDIDGTYLWYKRAKGTKLGKRKILDVYIENDKNDFQPTVVVKIKGLKADILKSINNRCKEE